MRRNLTCCEPSGLTLSGQLLVATLPVVSWLSRDAIYVLYGTDRHHHALLKHVVLQNGIGPHWIRII